MSHETDNQTFHEIPVKGMRKTIAQRMVESKNTAPHVTLFCEMDVTQLLRKLAEHNEKVHEKTNRVSLTAVLVSIASNALKEFPRINARLKDDKIVLREEIAIGVAVAVDEGLLVPVIKDTVDRPITDINIRLKEIVEKSRSRTISPDFLTGGSITITNLGMYSVDTFTPIINLPEASILGIGRAVKKPVVINGEIVVRDTMVFSLSFDHRVLDGAPAAQYLTILQQKVENIAEIT